MEETIVVSFWRSGDDWINGHCPDCYNTGEIVVCGYCENGDIHSHCDDSWTRPCGCKLYDHKHRFNNGGLWLDKRDGLWVVALDFVNYATTKHQQKTLDKESSIKYLEAQLNQQRKQVREDLSSWSEQDRMAFYEWSRGERQSI